MDSMSIMDCMSSCMAVMLGMQVQSMTPSMVIDDPPVAGAAGAAVVGAAVVVGAVSVIKSISASQFDSDIDMLTVRHDYKKQQNNNNHQQKQHNPYWFHISTFSYLHSETTVFLIPVLPVLGW